MLLLVIINVVHICASNDHVDANFRIGPQCTHLVFGCDLEPAAQCWWPLSQILDMYMIQCISYHLFGGNPLGWDSHEFPGYEAERVSHGKIALQGNLPWPVSDLKW